MDADLINDLEEIKKDTELDKVAEEKSPSQAKQLIDLCADVEFFHTPDKEGFATVLAGDHLETWSIKGEGFKNWLTHRYYQKTKSAPSSQAKQDALTTLESRAQYEGKEHEVHLRFGEHDDKVYVDLGDAKWQGVEISSLGWNVITAPPVKFRRPKGMLALPAPVKSDPALAIKKLRAYLNLPPDSEDEFKLIVAWVLSAMKPGGPFPVMVPYGEQGTGKSTVVRILRALVDPNASPLRREPKNADDLMVSAKGNWVVAMDNVSKLSDEMSDDICRLATGGGLSKRQLYSDDGEVVLNAKRPCILNGIEEFVTRGDLADRSIIISLPTISEGERRREETFWSSFDRDKGEIFGALCTAISVALRERNLFELKQKPRMADAFHWVSAAETAFGWQREDTLKAFMRNQQMANEIVLASSPLFKYVTKYADQRFAGPAQLLLDNIKGDADPSEARFLPTVANKLSDKLRRLAPALKKAGIEVEISRKATERQISLKRIVTTVTSVTARPRYDDRDDHDDKNRAKSVQEGLPYVS